MTKLLSAVLLFISSFAFAGNKFYAEADTTKPISHQSEKKIADTEEDPIKIFVKVETEASFPGGETEWRFFLERKLNASVPAQNNAPKGTYLVIIQFIVDTSGNISDIKPLTKHGYGMEEEVMRILKKGPKWIPATQNSKPVIAYRKQPVTFYLGDGPPNWNKN
jgi:hypothetical protein